MRLHSDFSFGNYLAIFNVVPFLVSYVFINALVAALIAWKLKGPVSWISYIVIAFLLYPQFLFLWDSNNRMRFWRLPICLI